MEQPPDWIALVEAAIGGDVRAQGELLSRFDPLARSMACRLVDEHRVDDVVQESCAVALDTIGRLRTPAAFPSWFRLIIRKQASRLRPDSRDVAFDTMVQPRLPGADPADQLEQRELVELVRLALAAASDDDRRLLELRYLAGWSNAELAGALGVSTGAVRKRLHDARRRARPHFDHLDTKEQTMHDHRRHLGRVHDATIAVPAGPALRPPGPEPAVTGLKVIDTMAPIRRGGTIEMTGPAGTGQVVVVFELLYRLGRTEHDVACVGVGRAGASIGAQRDLAHIVSEPGIPGPNAAILVTDPADTARAYDAGSRLAAGLAADGIDVILAVDRPSLDHLDPSALAAGAGLAAAGSVTVVALNVAERGAAAPRAPMGLDTTLVFSVEHLALGIFPAIDGARSRSVLDVSDAAREAKRRLADAAALRGWFDQTLFVARDHTGVLGTWFEPALVEAELAGLTRA